MYKHISISKLTIDESKESIDKTDKILENIYKDAGVERKKKLLRFPYGGYSSLQKKKTLISYLEEYGYKNCNWTLDTDDWKYYVNKISKEEILKKISATRNKEIVLMHDKPLTPEFILPYYADRMYVWKTL